MSEWNEPVDDSVLNKLEKKEERTVGQLKNFVAMYGTGKKEKFKKIVKKQKDVSKN